MTPLGLTETIKRFALDEAGFDLVGIARASLPEFYGQGLRRWVEKGHAAGMEYMKRDTDRRADAVGSLPSAVSVISLAVNYYHPEDSRPTDRPVGKVARYAYGRDYHRLIEKKLKKLTLMIGSLPAEHAETKAYVDTGPILEKAYAREAGLGFFGKNTNIITREFGSWVFLASVITSLELVPDQPHTGSCGSCRICIDACPTEALLGNYEMDASKCISYLTIESRDPMPADLGARTGEWVFGCDICQEVCPYNFRAKTTQHPDLYQNRIAGTWIDLKQVMNMTIEEDFKVRFQGSAVKRAKLGGLQRNAKNILEKPL